MFSPQTRHPAVEPSTFIHAELETSSAGSGGTFCVSRVLNPAELLLKAAFRQNEFYHSVSAGTSCWKQTWIFFLGTDRTQTELNLLGFFFTVFCSGFLLIGLLCISVSFLILHCSVSIYFSKCSWLIKETECWRNGWCSMFDELPLVATRGSQRLISAHTSHML